MPFSRISHPLRSTCFQVYHQVSHRCLWDMIIICLYCSGPPCTSPPYTSNSQGYQKWRGCGGKRTYASNMPFIPVTFGGCSATTTKLEPWTWENVWECCESGFPKPRVKASINWPSTQIQEVWRSKEGSEMLIWAFLFTQKKCYKYGWGSSTVEAWAPSHHYSS